MSGCPEFSLDYLRVSFMVVRFFEFLFGAFKLLAFGECVTIATVLLAQLALYPEMASISPLTIFPYLLVRGLGSDSIYILITFGSVFGWMVGDDSQ